MTAVDDEITFRPAPGLALAEQIVCGIALEGRAHTEQLAGIVRPDQFANGKHQAIFGAEARLAAIDPARVPTASYWFLRGSCADALGRPEDAASAFRRAGAASSDERFRASFARP